MKPPRPETLEEALRFAEAVRLVVGMQRWGWSKALIRDTWPSEQFQIMIDSDWNTRWTDEQCCSILAIYRLSK